jgi:Arc/MetJ-type ribon-helix-helix transcriptional regulator
MKKSTTIVIRTPKKKRPPVLGEKAARVLPIRLPDEMIVAVDEFAARGSIKGRSEAIRRLLELGLTCGTVTQVEAKRAAAPKRRKEK